LHCLKQKLSPTCRQTKKGAAFRSASVDVAKGTEAVAVHWWAEGGEELPSGFTYTPQPIFDLEANPVGT
jgi:hypothetical protein